MYASQTKRLCVRGASSDETRVQHHSSSSEHATTGLINHQQQPNHSSISQSPLTPPSNQSTTQVVSGNMTASATGMLNDENNSSCKTSTITPTTSRFHHHQQQPQNDQSTEMSNSAVPAAGTSGESVEHDLINKLANETIEEAKIEILLSIRNLITACNKKKDSIVSNPNFSKIIDMIDDDKLVDSSVKTQLALLLCSLAKGGERNVRILNESLVDDKIFKLILNSKDEALIEACLRCMRSIMSWPRVSRTWLLYESSNQKNGASPEKDRILGSHNGLLRMIAYARPGGSLIVQECIADIFAATCARNKDQALLFKASSLSCIVQLLESPSSRVIIASLNWLTQMCLKNHSISLETTQAYCPSGMLVLDRLITMMNKDTCYELQFLSARCFAYIYRALVADNLKDDNRIVSHVLPTLVRMVHKDKPPHLRIKSAECIAYLIECEVRLQSTASVCDHLIDSLANMLEYEHTSILLELKDCTQNQVKTSRVHDRGISWLSIAKQQQQPSLDLRLTQSEPSNKESVADGEFELLQEMKRSAFLALAALSSNLEPIRKKIFQSSPVMKHLVKSLAESDTKTLKSVLTCLLSLSRSVQQLRTSFAENSVYSALKNLLTTTSKDVLILVLAILCNISLDFSPGKQHFLDTKTIDILCNLTRKSDSILRLHGMWILMNMVYQLKDQNLKFQILRSLGINHLLSLLESEDDAEMVLKTLGFLRNLLSQKLHIDAIMTNHGEQIMQSLIRILDKSCSSCIKEQCLCVLTNIADGTESKTFIMDNRVVLTYLSRIICDETAGDLRLAAICCITNLAHKEYDGAYERRDTMKQYGIEEKLKSMLSTNDPILSDRVRTAYNQFLIGVDDKYVN